MQFFRTTSRTGPWGIWTRGRVAPRCAAAGVASQPLTTEVRIAKATGHIVDFPTIVFMDLFRQGPEAGRSFDRCFPARFQTAAEYSEACSTFSGYRRGTQCDGFL